MWLVTDCVKRTTIYVKRTTNYVFWHEEAVNCLSQRYVQMISNYVHITVIMMCLMSCTHNCNNDVFNVMCT